VDGLNLRETEWLGLDDDLQLARWRTDRLLALGYEPPEAATARGLVGRHP
jgi:hypothetical protein